MKLSYIPIKSTILTLILMISTHAQPDTVVLNSTELRFPETHPGRVFIVKKIVVNGQQPLKKAAEAAPSGKPAPAAAPSVLADRAGARDAMGRVLKSGEYASRMARIEKAHKLPTAAARGTQRQGLFTEAGNGRMVRFQKSEGARVTIASNSPLIKTSQDLARMERLEREAVRRKHGKLSPALAKKLERLKSDEEVEVSIELAKENPGFIDGSKATLAERKANAQAWARSGPKVSIQEFARSQGLQVSASQARSRGASLKARVSRSKLQELARDKQVVAIFEARPVQSATIQGPGPVSYQKLIDAAYNPPGTMTNYGANAATMELGLSPQYVSCINPGERPTAYDSYGTSRDGHSAHSEATYHTLALGTPGSTRRHYASWAGEFAAIKQDIIDDGIEVVTTSFYMPWLEEDTPDSRIVDAFAYIGPYPIIVVPTANLGHEYVVYSRTYNSLVAGNVQHYDDNEYTVDFKNVPFGGPYYEHIVPASQSTNPPAKYGATNDWELPTLVAPGFSPDPWWSIRDTGLCVHYNNNGDPWGPAGGTSFSSPVLGAMAANVFGATGGSWNPASSLMTKAALLVTAENVDGDDASMGGDQRDGFGTVSGSNAVKFIETAYWVAPYSAAEVQGVAYGTMDSSYFISQTPIIYKFKAPSSFPSGKHLRVVLTWTSSPGVDSMENEISDLALEATDKHGSIWADRTNGNIETIDFPSALYHFNTNGQYEISIYPLTFRKAADGPNYLQYSLAWTWVKDHAD